MPAENSAAKFTIRPADARRRRIGGGCALGLDEVERRARPAAGTRCASNAARRRQAEGPRRRQPARNHRDVPSRSAIFGNDTHFSAAHAYRMARSESLSVRRVRGSDGNAIRRSSRAKPGGRDAEVPRRPSGISSTARSATTGRSAAHVLGRNREPAGKGAANGPSCGRRRSIRSVHSYCTRFPLLRRHA